MLQITITQADFVPANRDDSSAPGELCVEIGGIVEGHSPRQHELLKKVFAASSKIVHGSIGYGPDGRENFLISISALEDEVMKPETTEVAPVDSQSGGAVVTVPPTDPADPAHETGNPVG